MQGPTEKPEYLGLLNAISLAESEAGVYLQAWANATTDEDLACTLRFVAAREASHGEVFCRRLAELGYDLKPKADPEAAARLARYANPRVPDVEKIPADREEPEDNTFFRDTDRQIAEGRFDALTCNLMQWYITEEKDSARRLSEAYAAVRAKAPGKPRKGGGQAVQPNGAGASPSADAEAIMACMTAGFKSLEKSLERLAKAVR